MPEKIIRDPVHDVIAFQTDRPVDGLLFNLINAAEFQRLRRIRQLGLATLAYPGAEHTRYSHSLGVMETARKMLARLGLSITIDEESRTVCLAAALLHDLGHGPFSHVFEPITGIAHEDLSRQIIEDPETEIHRILADHDSQLPARVVRMLAGQPCRSYLCDILTSQLDADRFDYLLRDNLMTGSGYGGFDFQWLLHHLTVDPVSNRLAITWKGVSAIEAYLQARYHMYRNVYFHKVVRSADGMLRLALRRAKLLAMQDRLTWPVREQALHRAMIGLRLETSEFLELDDVLLLHHFKMWTTADDPILADLCRGLLLRRLYKSIDLSRIEDDADARRRMDAARHAVAAAGGNPDYDLFYDEPADTPYETFASGQFDRPEEILIREADGQLTPFASISPLTQALNRQLLFRRIHFAEKWKETVTAAAGL